MYNRNRKEIILSVIAASNTETNAFTYLSLAKSNSELINTLSSARLQSLPGLNPGKSNQDHSLLCADDPIARWKLAGYRCDLQKPQVTNSHQFPYLEHSNFRSSAATICSHKKNKTSLPAARTLTARRSNWIINL